MVQIRIDAYSADGIMQLTFGYNDNSFFCICFPFQYMIDDGRRIKMYI